MDSVIVEFLNLDNGNVYSIEIPLDISANELIVALNNAYHLGLDTMNYTEYYLGTENPIAFLRGSRLLKDYGIRNGTKIFFKRS